MIKSVFYTSLKKVLFYKLSEATLKTFPIYLTLVESTMTKSGFCFPGLICANHEVVEKYFVPHPALLLDGRGAQYVVPKSGFTFVNPLYTGLSVESHLCELK